MLRLNLGRFRGCVRGEGDVLSRQFCSCWGGWVAYLSEVLSRQCTPYNARWWCTLVTSLRKSGLWAVRLRLSGGLVKGHAKAAKCPTKRQGVFAVKPSLRKRPGTPTGKSINAPSALVAP